MDTVSIIWVLVGTLAGVIAGGGTAAMVLARANRSKELKDTTEELAFKSIPPQALETINAMTTRFVDFVERHADALKEIALQGGAFVRDVTDGLPNTGADLPKSAAPDKAIG